MKLPDYFERQAEFAALHEAFTARGVSQVIDAHDVENQLDSPDELEHYFHVGDDALRIIVAALARHGRDVPSSLLDFPSGSGRVARHLAAFFPDADLVVADLYESHVEFCAREFAATAVVSAPSADDVDFGRTFDVIFCGSLLTHLAEAQFTPMLELLARSLSPTGIAIVSLQGRHADVIQARGQKYAADELYDRARKAVERRGIGFVDYADWFRSKFFKQRSYGITLVRPSWVAAQVQRLAGVRLLEYAEMDWDQHQDVLVFGRPGIDVA